jgi:hypothetical protein
VQITFDLPHVFCPGSSPVVNSHVLRALLDTLISVNMNFLRINPRFPRIYSPDFNGLHYVNTEVWDCIPALYQRGYGDCKSLSSALIAERRVLDRKQAEPVFRFVHRPDGGIDYHILVWNGGNKWEDPSVALGMPSSDANYYAQNGVTDLSF